MSWIKSVAGKLMAKAISERDLAFPIDDELHRATQMHIKRLGVPLRAWLRELIEPQLRAECADELRLVAPPPADQKDRATDTENPPMQV